jgi:hypothetical protein
VALREIVLRAEAFFAVTVAFAEAFVGAFFTTAAFFFDVAAFLAPSFLLAERTFDAAFGVVALRFAVILGTMTHCRPI